MKEMRINVKNTEKIEKVINEIKGQYRTELLTSEKILKLAETCEKHMERFGLKEEDRQGARFLFRAEGFTNDRSTGCVLERGLGRWLLVKIENLVKTEGDLDRMNWINSDEYHDLLTDVAHRVQL
jgi:hypothetical protein